MEYNPRCEIRRVAYQITYFWTSILPLSLDLIILALTVKRVFLLNRQPHPIPILRTVIVDGTWAIFIVWSPVAGAIGLAVTGHVRASYVIANSWMVTMTSFAATRTVLNVQKYNAPALRYSDEAHDTAEEYNLTLTAYVPAEGTFTLRSRNCVA